MDIREFLKKYNKVLNLSGLEAECNIPKSLLRKERVLPDKHKESLITLFNELSNDVTKLGQTNVIKTVQKENVTNLRQEPKPKENKIDLTPRFMDIPEGQKPYTKYVQDGVEYRYVQYDGRYKLELIAKKLEFAKSLLK